MMHSAQGIRTASRRGLVGGWDAFGQPDDMPPEMNNVPWNCLHLYSVNPTPVLLLAFTVARYHWLSPRASSSQGENAEGWGPWIVSQGWFCAASEPGMIMGQWRKYLITISNVCAHLGSNYSLFVGLPFRRRISIYEIGQELW
jgi:hypothetical protein